MEMTELAKYFERDRNVEKEILAGFSNILRNHFTREEIEKTLLENGFNGVYLLDEEQIESLNDLLDEDDKQIILSELRDLFGTYYLNEKIIIMNKNEYLNNKEIGIHEMGHAFLDSRNEAIIQINSSKIRYGIGLEEGAVTSLMVTDDIEDISNYSPNVYPDQTIFFQQLNALYQYTTLKKYPNLLIHMFKEPEKFMVLVREIYTDIYEQNYETMDNSVITKSAFDIVVGTDMLTTDNSLSLEGFKLMHAINTIYLHMADKDIRNKNKRNTLFKNFKELEKTNEEILLGKIFGDDGGYMERLSNLLEDLVLSFQADVEKSKTKTFSL